MDCLFIIAKQIFMKHLNPSGFALKLNLFHLHATSSILGGRKSPPFKCSV